MIVRLITVLALLASVARAETVTVLAGNGFGGSGIAVEKLKVANDVALILTCRHIGDGVFPRPSVQYFRGDRWTKPYQAELLRVHKSEDLAVLIARCPGDLQPTPVAEREPRAGEVVILKGVPAVANGQIVTRIARLLGYDDTDAVISTRAESGDSGGNMHNADGEVFAVLWGHELDGHARGTIGLRQFLRRTQCQGSGYCMPPQVVYPPRQIVHPTRPQIDPAQPFPGRVYPANPQVSESIKGPPGRGIQTTRLEGSDLIVVYDDGKEQNVGRVVGDDGASTTIVEPYQLTDSDVDRIVSRVKDDLGTQEVPQTNDRPSAPIYYDIVPRSKTK